MRRWLAVAALSLSLVPSPLPASPAADGATLTVWTEGPQPAFALEDLNRETRALRDFAGKTVLVHFFATWCEPCVRELASLQSLAAALRDRPFAIVAVDVAEVDLRVRAFFEKHPASFPVLLDRDRAVAKAWQVNALPTTFVLDADLAPKLFVEGDLDWSEGAIRSAIESLSPPGARKTTAVGTIRSSDARHSTTPSTEETAQ